MGTSKTEGKSSRKRIALYTSATLSVFALMFMVYWMYRAVSRATGAGITGIRKVVPGALNLVDTVYEYQPWGL